MKSLKLMCSTLLLGVFFATFTQAQTETPQDAAAAPVLKTETYQVLGNCGMCKRTIEKAAVKAGVATASWDSEKDQLTVSFDPAKTNADAILKAVALSGYDNIAYKAPEDAYNDLPGCCHYDRSGAPSSAKACEPDGKQ